MPQFDPSRLQERLSALENVQPVAPTPAFDPSSLQARLDALENREPVAAPPAFDPSGLMARLDDFESRLGALQQPFTPTDLEPQPPNEIPKPIPGGGMPIPSFDPAPPSVPIQGPPLRGSKIIPGGRPTPPMSIGGLEEACQNHQEDLQMSIHHNCTAMIYLVANYHRHL